MSPKDFCVLFAREWKNRHGQNLPISWGKDTAIFKRLRAEYADEYLVELVRHYHSKFESFFARRAGFRLNAFAYELPSIILQFETEKSKRSEVDETNYRRLEEKREK